VKTSLLFLALLLQEPPRKDPAPAEPPAPRELSSPKAVPRYTALVGGDVYTVTRGVMKGGTVLLKDDRIHRIGVALDLPEGTTRIDVAGKRVLPGFIAVYARAVGMPLSFMNVGKVSDAVDPFHDSIQLALSGGLTSAFVENGGGEGFFGGGGSPGPSAVIKMSYGTLEGMVILEPASVSLSAWVTGGAAERFEIRESFRKAREYLERERDFETRKAEKKLGPQEAPPKPAAAIENHVKLLKGELTARISASDAGALKRALELVGEFRIRAVLTDVIEGWTMPDEIGRARAYCTFTVRTKEHPDRNLARSSGSSIEQAAILRKAGVKFAIVPITPTVSTGGLAGRDLLNLPIEAAFAIRGGLDEQTALESITITAAEISGVDHRLGSIEEGKDADLVVLDGDPFDYRTFVELTFVNGKLLYDKAKSPYFSHLKPRR
jgi:imidazolonepropionase-like amidohydrolase